MAISQLFDRVRVNVSTSGTADFVITTAVAGFRTPADAGVADGTPVTYTAQSSDLLQWEVGQGFYVAATTTIQRSNVSSSSNANALVNFTASPVVFLDAVASDIEALSFSTTAKVGDSRLNFHVLGGLINTSTGPAVTPNDTFNLVDNATNYVGVVNVGATGVWQNSTTSFTPGHFNWPAWQVVVAGGIITSLTDMRTGAAVLPSGAGSGTISQLNAGAGITLTPNPIVGPTGTIANAGVLTINAGAGINSTGGQNPTISNSAVLTVSAGTNVTVTGTAQNPVINASGGGGGGPLPNATSLASQLVPVDLVGTYSVANGAINAGNPAFGNMVTDARAAIQAAYDYCVTNGFHLLYIPGRPGGRWELNGPVFFDPANNLRNGITLANQKLGQTAVPAVFTQGCEVFSDFACLFHIAYQTAPAFWIGTNHENRIRNLQVIGPRSDLGGSVLQIDPRCTAFAVASGNGGATDTVFESCYSVDIYYGSTHGQNGQNALAEDNRYYNCCFTGAYAIASINGQAFPNMSVGGNHNGLRVTFQNFGQEMTVIHGEHGTTVTDSGTTVINIAPSGLTPLTEQLPGGTNFTNYTWTMTSVNGPALLDGSFYANAILMALPSFGYVRIIQIADNGAGLGTYKLDLGWLFMYYGEDVALTATNFATELGAFTGNSVNWATRSTVATGSVSISRSHIETPTACEALYDTQPGQTRTTYGRCVLDNLGTQNWGPGSGGTFSTAVINRHWPFIRQLYGDVIVRDTDIPAHQAQPGSQPVVVQGFDTADNQACYQFIVTNCIGLAKTNLQYVGNSAAGTGNAITRGPGYDNTLTTQQQFGTKAFGFGRWDFNVWTPGQGIPGSEFISQQSGTRLSRFFGYRPDPSIQQKLTVSDINNLVAGTGTQQRLCGGYQNKISQIGTTATAGGPATSNTQDVHTVIDVGGAGFAAYGFNPSVTGHWNGTSHVVYVANGGNVASQCFWNGQEIILQPDDLSLAACYVIVTGCYFTDGFITVYNTASGAGGSLLPGTLGTSYNFTSVRSRSPVLSFPGQLRAARVSTQFDKTNAVLANVTGLSKNVFAGLKYRFTATLFTTSPAAGGVQAAVSGTCTATAVIYEGQTSDPGGTQVQTRATTLATVVGAVTAVTAARINIWGEITVATSGTLTVQFAQNVASGTSSVLVGSYMDLAEIP